MNTSLSTSNVPTSLSNNSSASSTSTSTSSGYYEASSSNGSSIVNNNNNVNNGGDSSCNSSASPSPTAQTPTATSNFGATTTTGSPRTPSSFSHTSSMESPQPECNYTMGPMMQQQQQQQQQQHLYPSGYQSDDYMQQQQHQNYPGYYNGYPGSSMPRAGNGNGSQRGATDSDGSSMYAPEPTLGASLFGSPSASDQTSTTSAGSGSTNYGMSGNADDVGGGHGNNGFDINEIKEAVKSSSASTSSSSSNSEQQQKEQPTEFRCNDCNKSFNKMCYLKQHNKSFHNGEKPFKCGQCGKRFPVDVLYHVSIFENVSS